MRLCLPEAGVSDPGPSMRIGPYLHRLRDASDLAPTTGGEGGDSLSISPRGTTWRSRCLELTGRPVTVLEHALPERRARTDRACTTRSGSISWGNRCEPGSRPRSAAVVATTSKPARHPRDFPHSQTGQTADLRQPRWDT
jgi:hypothetical protein